MSYLGNTPSETFHQATSQVFNGDGSTTAFTLEKRVNRAEEIEVFVNNIQQQPTVAYSANNTTLTFTEAPDSATGNIYVVYRMFAQQNTFNALHDFTDAVTMASTLGVTGVLTANAGVKVDNITIDGTEIDLSSGDLTLDVAGDIILDADGGDVKINDGGSARFHILTSATETQLFNQQQDADIVFKGDDGGSAVTALTLDMSDAGTAIFGHDIKIADNNNIQLGAGADLFMFSDGTDGIIDTLNGDLRLRADPNSGASSSMIKFEVDGTEGMRLISGKKLLVGNDNVGVHICRISGNSGGNAVLKVDNSASSGNTTCYLAFMDGSGSASSNSAFFQGFNGSNNFYLLGNGTHTFTSDENAKKNIETTRDGYLEDLAKLRVVKYNWKEQEDGEDKELGLIAQEVEKVFPKLVMNDIDPQIEEKDKKKMIKTTVLPFMLLKALQEANEKITTLETEVKALKGA